MPHNLAGPTFATRFAKALDASGMGTEQLSAQLLVRGIRTSPQTLQNWVDGRETPSPERDLRVLRALEQMLPSISLDMVDPSAGEGEREWQPLVGLPRNTPAWARMAEVRSLTEQQFVAEMAHDSSRLSADRMVLERTVHLVTRPLGSFRHEPSLLLLVPRGASVEAINGTGRERVTAPVPVGELCDMVQATTRRTSNTKAGRLQTSQMTFLITGVEPIPGIRLALPGPVDIFSFDVTFEGDAPTSATLGHRDGYGLDASPLPLEVGQHMQYTTLEAPIGLYDMEWSF
ncbi:hypothetical protein ACTQ49_05335 [Luteococcus sp. Sow4_B9]|uniref:hypothetical protein n=1 Tax=Luteococcus sp. Sow4_B9 TaxID=3438792 RepID=UPI003F96F50D